MGLQEVIKFLIGLILPAKIIFLIAFPVLIGMREYLILPVKKEISKDFHNLGFVTRGFPAFFMLVPYYSLMPAYAFYFWLVFDHIVGVGHTAAIDRIPYNTYIKVIGLVLSGFLPLLF